MAEWTHREDDNAFHKADNYIFCIIPYTTPAHRIFDFGADQFNRQQAKKILAPLIDMYIKPKLQGTFIFCA
jgi:L-ribulose-5-phosphate 3-epimerase UlaE